MEQSGSESEREKSGSKSERVEFERQERSGDGTRGRRSPIKNTREQDRDSRGQ